LEGDHVLTPNNAKAGVSDVNGTDADTSKCDDFETAPKELESDLGPYWTLVQSTCSYVLSTITSYGNAKASKSTPQYGFN
jgi:hypothetical protein